LIIQYEIEALAPLVFPERKPGTQFNRSLPYVPGSVIFGALGQVLANHPDLPAILRALRCHNAYPALPGDSWVRPIPATAIQPKGSTEMVQDSLYRRVCWERQQPQALVYAPTDDEGRPWETVGQKFYTLRDQQLVYRSVQQRMHTRVAINRQRGVAQNERLYSLLAIRETVRGYNSDQLMPTRFVGSMTVPDAYNATILQALQQITYIGGRQTSGFGAVQITPREQAFEPVSAIRQRVMEMTERFQQQAGRYERLGGRSWQITGHVFTINLLADTILLADGWLPTQELSATHLKALTGIDAELVRAFTATKTVGGWQALWQRPKPTNVAVTMGSVYVFATQRHLTDHDYKQLAALQLVGIGERRQEGYGQIRVCDEFHLR